MHKIRHTWFLFLTISAICISVLSSCDAKPNSRTEQAWQKNFKEALVDGYKNFTGQFVDDDSSVYIFSYEIPEKLKTKDVFFKFHKQINSNYILISETETELVLRYPISDPWISNGFNEYHFLINPQYGTVTVMFANLDTERELKLHQAFTKELYRFHQEYTAEIIKK